MEQNNFQQPTCIFSATTVNPLAVSTNGTLLMTGAEQTLYEGVSAVNPKHFYGGNIWLPASAAADFRLRVYAKLITGGTYRALIDLSTLAVGGGIMLHLTPGVSLLTALAGAAASIPVPVPAAFQFGLKVTLAQTTVGAGYVTLEKAFYDSLGA